ncbi:hypothetical protein OG594_08970 [Streptomyces sp. NBC_01214]|uniref:hypothetical protein n=1 Tax=Streptomyces sp. NBC_01214 TaxID=2903777 RepID=UPI002256C421|nr:hypothetical protein [Streptomyces sp. NBC_01214]MCX4801781.1 hypothetical protein [Streptomyces sp. NBC_01214]
MGGPLRLYDVVMHGVPTRMKLNEADAERYGGTLVNGPAGPEPEAPEAEAKTAEAPAKSRTPANKSRTARGKAAPGGD